jgi:hypothetical protein
MGHDLLGRGPDFESILSLPSPVASGMGPAAASQSLACRNLDVHHFVPSLIQHAVMSSGVGHKQQVLLSPHGHLHCRWYAPEHPHHPPGILSLYCVGCCMLGLRGCQQHMSPHSHQWIPKVGPSFVTDLQGHPTKHQTYHYIPTEYKKLYTSSRATSQYSLSTAK